MYEQGMDRPVERLSFVLFVVGFAISAYIFIVVQVLQSYPFPHQGVYGDQQFFVLTYSEALEVAGPLSMAAFAAWSYARSALSRSMALLHATGRTLVVFGGLVAGIVYTEIHLIWGELWYGLHVWPSLPGGGGYPWGDEQVAYNLCFIKESTFTAQTPNCSFLNYNWLLGFAVAALLAGAVIEFYFRSAPPLNGMPPTGRIEGQRTPRRAERRPGPDEMPRSV